MTTTVGTDAEVSAGIKICDYYTNNGYPQFLGKSRSATLYAPRTNIDVVYDSFGKKLTKAKFTSSLTAVVVAKNAAGSLNSDYSFDNFLASVAQFPFFCNVEENKQNTDKCD